MLQAAFFDWGNTLVSFEWDDALVEAGHRAALGRDDSEFTARWRELLLGGSHGRRPYAELLAELGVEDPNAFIDAEHACWLSAYGVLSMAPALLEMLRERGLKTALVADPWPDPPRVIAGDIERLGFAPLLDAVMLGDDSLARACRELEVDPGAVLFVGDSLADVQRAADAGMKTVQALWFRADDNPEIEPDFQAFTAVDVISIVRRLTAA
ncbi:MAG TPA: HAD family hydrolase [Gaiellaceae bacterium]|jgi:FMN phosphatase YigB (HAD superfamily)